MKIQKYCKNSAQYCAILQYFSIIAQKTSAILQYFSTIALKYCNNSEKYWLILCIFVGSEFLSSDCEKFPLP